MNNFLLRFSVSTVRIVNVSVCLVVFGFAFAGIVVGVTELRDTALILLPFVLVTSYLSHKRRQLEEGSENE
ncbi:hypothetical protein ACE1TF_04620 [Geomicrobium sp. JSM 1781026]|uniref:hypothetical protein n=1 Tax=unclassified Geomicrobium TaxID=2628951 RepID=UPI0005A8DDD8|nr:MULTISPECIES: hypothetical protein [unclassified Geomicrobium]